MPNASTSARTLAATLLALGLCALAVACGSESNVNLREAFCDDGADSDFDGRIDCDDPDCARAPACAAEHCYNLRDDDKDGLLDCDDSDCAGSSVCLEVGEHCVSGEDDDGDGQTDCADSDCAMTAACTPDGENCTNGIDDDGDGDIDCVDTDCEKTAICLPRAEDCTNGDDDDEDGQADCDDTDCARTRDCLDTGEDCANEVDDDNDGAIDCGDGDCAQTATCLPISEGCANGVDDDADGDVDCEDGDCSASPDCRMPTEYCTNGIDDDDDGLVDCDDFDDCGLRAPCLDEPAAEVCDDGFDDNDNGATDCADPDCADFAGCQEAGLCDNGLDDDDDGFIDCEDSECAGEPVCNTVSVSVLVNGRGTVRSLNGDIACPAECQATVPTGTTLEFVSVGDLGHNLLEWQNCDNTAANTCTITAQADIEITANFGELAQYTLPGISGCEGVDAGLLVLDEARLDNLGPDELSTTSTGWDSGDYVEHPNDNLREATMQFNAFEKLSFEATHACVQLAEVSLAMESRGSYSFYLAKGDFGSPEPPMTVISRIVVPTPQDAGMQLIELTAPYGPETLEPVWAGVAFPGGVNTSEIATTPTVAPGILNDAYLAYASTPDPGVPYLQQFGWQPYDELGDARYTDLQPVIRLLRAVDPADVTSFTLDVEASGDGDVVSNNGLISCPGVCGADFSPLQEVVLEAQPGPNLSATWTGCDQAIDNFCVVRMIDNRSVSVQFN